MKTTIALLAGLALAAAAQAQVPPMLSYQGQVSVDGTNFSGSGSFKFALVNTNGSVSYWSNDGTSAGGSQPANAVGIPVAGGLYSVALGDTAIANMQAVPSGTFSNANVRLRIWFNDGISGWQQLSPDQPVLSVGYAMMSQSVPDGSVTTDKLANGSVTAGKIAAGAVGALQIAVGAVNSSDIADNSITSADIADGTITGADIQDGTITAADIANSTITTAKLADNSVDSTKLADDLDLGTSSVNGRLDVFHTTAGTAAISLDGANNTISVFGDDGAELGRLWGISYGELYLKDSTGHETAARLTANGNGGGRMYLYNSNGVTRALVSGENAGGVMYLYQADGSGAGALLDGNNSYGAGQLTLYQGDGQYGALIYGDDGQGSGAISLRKTNGNPGLRLYGGPSAGSLWLYNYNGYANVGLWSWDNEEGVVSVRNKVGNETIYLWGRNSQDTSAGQIGLKKSNGTETITLNADYGGEGRIITQVLQITGGSDLSEQFDINAGNDKPEPGMVVCIDPANPGDLRVSTRAYDHNVAGVVSGAGGVKPGMLMGQAGTAADGKHPVALTGRVYCKVDASYGAIQPGDLITTSDTPGHGMRVSNPAQAQGAIIGKAMTALDSGKGLVLVLVSLQ